MPRVLQPQPPPLPQKVLSSARPTPASTLLKHDWSAIAASCAATPLTPGKLPLLAAPSPRQGRHVFHQTARAASNTPSAEVPTLTARDFAEVKFLGWRPSAELVESSTGAAVATAATFTEGFSPRGLRLPRLAPSAVATCGPGGALKAGERPRALWSDSPQLREEEGFNMKRWRPDCSAKSAADSCGFSEGDAGPRAIWSDADQLRESDGFNMKKWRAEFSAELAKAGKKMAVSTSSYRGSGNGLDARRESRRGEAPSQMAGIEVEGPLDGFGRIDEQLSADEMVDAFISQNAVDGGAVLRDDLVGTFLEERAFCANARARRRRQLMDDAGHAQRRRCAQRRSGRVSATTSRTTFCPSAASVIDEDTEMLAKEERSQQAVARIKSRKLSFCGGEAPESPGGRSHSPDERPITPRKALRDRIKFAVTRRLHVRRKQAKKLAQLKDLRIAQVNELPKEQRSKLETAFNYYCKDVYGRRVVQVVDLPHCLLEAGLSGTNCSERWSVDRVCKEVVFGLTLEYGSFEKIPPIGEFRGSLCKAAGDTSTRRESAVIFGPMLNSRKSRAESDSALHGRQAEESSSAEEASASHATDHKEHIRRKGSSMSSSLSSVQEGEEERDAGETCSAPKIVIEHERGSQEAASGPRRSPRRSTKNALNPTLSNIDEEDPEPGEAPAEQTIIELLGEKGEHAGESSARSDSVINSGRMSSIQTLSQVEAGLWRQPDTSGRCQNNHVMGTTTALLAARKFMLTRPISFEDFAVEVVPVVQTELSEVRQDVYFSEFMKVLEANDKSAVCLSIEQFERLATRFDIAPDIFEKTLANLPEQPCETDNKSDDSSEADPVPGDVARSFARGSKAGNVEDPRLSFEAVHEMLLKMQEECEATTRKQEREIMERTGMSMEKFWEHRPELVRLYEFFHLYDQDHSGCLSHQEVKLLLKQLGLQPYRQEQAKLLEMWLEHADSDGNESLEFCEFLVLMLKVREHQKSQHKAKVWPSFRKMANGDGGLDIDRVDEALASAGIGGQTRFEQDLQRKLVYDQDVDNSGEINFSEYLDICQRVQERLFAYKMEEIVSYANSIGIDKARLGEYIWAFDQHDVDGSGGLSMDEIHKALHVLTVRPPTKAELEELFEKCQVKPDVEVPLQQYLKIMQIASAGRGMFARELPFTLKDVPDDKLREMLRMFPLAESYIKQLEKGELTDLLGSYLSVRPDSNLREAFPGKSIGNVRQLSDHARRISNMN